MLRQVLVSWHAGAYFFFLPLAIFGNFLIINLFLAVLKSEFEEFQKSKNIHQRDRLELAIAGKNSLLGMLSRFSSLGKRDKAYAMTSFMQKDPLYQASLSKLQISRSKISVLSAEHFGASASETTQPTNTRFYRRLLMKILHFEKYSQQFASAFDRAMDVCLDYWEKYFEENILKFPLNNIINPSVKIIFSSSEDVLQKESEKKFLNLSQRIENQLRFHRLHFDVRKYLEINQLRAVISTEKKEKQRRSLPLDLRRVKPKPADPNPSFSVKNAMKTKGKMVESVFRNSIKLRNSISKGDVDVSVLMNYEDMKKIIHENLLKESRKLARTEESLQNDAKAYYDILVKKNAVLILKLEFLILIRTRILRRRLYAAIFGLDQMSSCTSRSFR